MKRSWSNSSKPDGLKVHDGLEKKVELDSGGRGRAVAERVEI